MKRSLVIILACAASLLTAQAQQWPEVRPEAKAGARWWWLGSAVDQENLAWTMQEYANHGIGALEITPIYGVQGNQANNIPYLSDKWMEMLREVQKNGRQMGIEVDMATGTGWPFGGPWVPLEESACKVIWRETSFNNHYNTPIVDVDLSAPEKDRPYSKLLKVMAFPNWKFDISIDSFKKMPKEEGAAYRLAHLRNMPKGIDITAYVKDGKLNMKQPKKVLGENVTVLAIYARYGVMKVKRAAPSGEGLVIDHFDKDAVAHYLQHIEAAFERTGTPYPHTFFNDSYEVADATWTPTLFEEFEKRRGYRLEEQFYQLVCGVPEVVSDYRETLGDLLLENFTNQWTAWAHSHGAITRNQAHGSPANLIDCYAAVDIPEIEGFGLSEFGIKGLRQDPGKTRKNDSDFSMLKYAPSAAHICGKPYTSSETFTWLTEHFRTSLSQLKPDIDLMFCAGVNHMFFHGTCYSPKNDPWPGWKFYASIDMSPTNSIWRDAPYFMQYVERCQSFLQWGQPDNDFLVYLPIRDMWMKQTGKLLMQFSIHQMGKLAPEFIQTILDIDRAGFDCDYISDKYLLSTTYRDGMLQTAAGTRYRGLVIPECKMMPEQVRQHIEQLKAQGAHIIYGTAAGDLAKAAKPEAMRTLCGLKVIRRKNPTGYHYFIANLTPNDITERVSLAVPFESAAFFNPLNGDITQAPVSAGQVHLSLRSGESIILETFHEPVPLPAQSVAVPQPLVQHVAVPQQLQPLPLNGPWTLTFTEEAPKVAKTFSLTAPQTWETLDDDSVRVTMGTGIYTTHVKLTKRDLKDATRWQIDLGDVRESARVYINGQFIGCAWSVPFILDCKNTLRKGDNEIRIEVTNLPANRIADLDRRGVKWRKMEEINVVDINYKRTTYDTWEPVPSGLNSPVRLLR
ncbi:MAG: glycosyl hydrolase family 2 [Prevotella sp.]|nr:glycosyl hydrolase family 2 [Prevotella sp.]